MSGGTVCKCGESREPLTAKPGSDRVPRLWRIIDYKCNHSAFNGYHRTPSNYSELTCIRCGTRWRTKADYVIMLPGLKEEEQSISRYYPGHAEAMAKFGREVVT